MGLLSRLKHRIITLLPSSSKKWQLGGKIWADNDGARGSSGCLVADKGHVCMLTCMHILTDDLSIPPNQRRVYTPAIDGSETLIGKVVRSSSVTRSSTNRSDAVLVGVENKKDVITTIPYGIGEISESPRGIDAINLGDHVRLYGAKSKGSLGSITGIHDLPIQDRSGTSYHFSELIEVSPVDPKSRIDFCQNGDSGSIVVDVGSAPARVIGLLVGRRGVMKRGLIIPIEVILDDFGIELLSS